MIILVGHRGVGKTSLLRRIERYHQQVGKRDLTYVDLDEEIAKSHGQSVAEIIENKGEFFFRDAEKLTFNSIVNSNSDYVALGAGFSGEIPTHAQVIWVRRESDEQGRIFLDRPRLDREVGPLQEFLQRKMEREIRYREQCHFQWILREGIKGFDQAEFMFFTGALAPVEGVLTANENWLRPKNAHFIRKLPYQYLELRDDLLSDGRRREFYQIYSQTQFLQSHRTGNTEVAGFLDWAIELGCGHDRAKIISAHDRLEGESLEEFFDRLEKFAVNGQILKAAPRIENFLELKVGYMWQSVDPHRRAFLPRSANGRWRWFRLLMRGKQPLNFWRVDEGSALDQPTLAQWLNQSAKTTEFAAVLGCPIDHSRTPVEQQEFFAKHNMPVYAIEIKEQEWDDALPVLRLLGLRAAAVTAPLKHKAFLLSTQKTDSAQRYQAVNTLYFSGKETFGDNSDGPGLRQAIEGLNIPPAIAIWGGGGTAAVVSEIFPRAARYSARTGYLLNGESIGDAQTLIWCCGSREGVMVPPQDWPIQLIIDLDYRENSKARELALAWKCRYVSGEQMFYAQAELQRKFWRAHFSVDT